MKIELGQTLYVTSFGTFTKTEPNLTEYEVVKITRSLIHAKKKGTEFIVKFDRKTMSHNGGIGFQDKAYLTEKEYWLKVSLDEEKQALKENIKNSLNQLDLDVLRKIDELIRSK